MELTSQIQALIAVGAAVSANCQPCLQSTVAVALENGVAELEITEAIEVGKRIRRGAATKMDKFTSELKFTPRSPIPVMEEGCGCGLL